jgi:GntR family transcriptional regulator/MocR family aminotransferase
MGGVVGHRHLSGFDSGTSHAESGCHKVHFLGIMATTSEIRPRSLDLPIALDPAHGATSDQIRFALRSAIVDGLLLPGIRLPSSRALAEQLRVRRNAVVAAYEHLLSDGLIEARHGSGTFVAAELPVPVPTPVMPGPALSTPPRLPFDLGHSYSDARLLAQLANALRRRVLSASPEDLGYGDPRGSLHLRRQIARYLATARGVRCDPGCIVVVSGTQHALRLCLDALLVRGDKIWMEDPGYHAAQRTFRATGMAMVPVPVDDDGIRVADGLRRAPRAKAAYVTPSHQFPTGVTMSMGRRVALLDWARAANAWILEDDYDSEFRYAGPPLSALAGIGGERVIYIGTFTKVLFAGLRVAYLVLPAELVERVVLARAAIDRFPSGFMLDAVGDLMADGMLTAHLRRMRQRYREARDVLATTLTASAGDALEVVVPTQGLHLVAYLPSGVPANIAARIRDEAGVATRLISEAHISPGSREGFILGYSGFGLAPLRDAADRLGKMASRHVRRTGQAVRRLRRPPDS